MTLDEFLDDYVPRVLRPMGDWRLHAYRDEPMGPAMLIRRGPPPVCWASCPLDCVVEGPEGTFSKGQSIGLSLNDITTIMSAADGRHTYTAIRARLLSGLGLSEAK